MDAWLRNARDAVAAAGGRPASELELSEDDAATLLGRAQGSADLDTLADSVPRSS